MEEAPHSESVVIAGGLVVEHDIVGTGYAHEIIAARGGEEQEEVVSGILIGGRMVCIADITTHGQTEQLAHKVVFEPCANDLTLVVEIFGADEADNRIHKERIESTSDAIGSGFKG